MKTCHFLSIFLVVLCCPLLVVGQDMDKELSEFATKLSAQIQNQGKKKITVLDFTDLQGGSSELGRFIAENLTVNMVMTKREFSILDRANLKSILAEHKLTASGLVDPENAKKLGQFAGVDAIILGTIVPIKESIQLTAKIITTDTAEVVGAAKSLFKSDETIEHLLAKPTEPKIGGQSVSPSKEEKLIKNFGDLRMELSLVVVNGDQFLLTLSLTNQNPRKSIWVALNAEQTGKPKSVLTDSARNEWQSDWNFVSGIVTTSLQDEWIFKATEIKPNEATSATIKFPSKNGRSAEPGLCRLQLEFLVSRDFESSRFSGKASNYNIIADLKAN